MEETILGNFVNFALTAILFLPVGIGIASLILKDKNNER